jgi:very-short-patch-repair endonuclease
MADKPMCKGASFHIYRNAKFLRQHATEPEQKLWIYLRGRPLGFKFRRQHPLAVYIADFYCHKANLVIEIDGPSHSDPNAIKYDQERDRAIERMNLTTIRFSNEEVMDNFSSVADSIIRFLKASSSEKNNR